MTSPSDMTYRSQIDRRPATRPPRVSRPSRVGASSAYVGLIPLLLLTLSLVTPPELRIELADQNIYAYRFVYLALAPWCLYSVFSGGLTLRPLDAIVFASSLWMAASFIYLYGPADGLPSGVAVALDIAIPYLIARVSIRSLTDFRRYLITISPLVLLLAILLPIEALTQIRFIREFSIETFGRVEANPFGIKNQTRLGMLRASGPFSHPILAGLFFAGLLPLYWFSGIRGWPRVAGLVSGFAAFFTLSSAAVIGMVLFIGLALYDFLRRVVAFLTWPMFMAFSLVAMAVVHVASQNGLISVILRFTFNPGTGRYRLLIWEYGSESVAENPWFGIGFEDWARLPWMSTSVDTFWLALAMRNGLPAAVLLGLVTLLSAIGLAVSARRIRGVDQATLIGLSIAMFILFMQGFTVHFFGGLGIWFAVLLGIAVSFGYSGTQKRAVRPGRADRHTHRSTPSRIAGAP